ncbi:putative amidase-like protein [Desulfitobacterium sp. LBE]|uniref:amidase domain-containing protein n=2 Tax=Desulfitobacterium TaxID=36853 RepID=UPI00119A5F2A|nr:amidase domain-containing protein [Desulfitobacterium sp. LBE]TWH60694.1 putative amidase-like protein [Desulfitobacterium sp. LBE]
MKTKRNIFAYLIVAVLFVFGIAPNTLAATNTSNPLSAEEAVKSVISQYFDNYFKSYQTLELIDSDDLVVENENTLLYKKMHEIFVEGNKLVGLSYTTYKVDLDYQEIAYAKDAVNVSLLMNCAYTYSTTPDADSSMSNIGYRFKLVQQNDGYKITSIESDFSEFDPFKESVEEKLTSSRISKAEATHQTAEEWAHNIRDAAQYISGKLQASEENPPASIEPASEVTPMATYSFNRMLARNWAHRFAESSESERFFYTASGGDCTNFASQCIWAGYGGYVEGNDTQTKNNIRNRVRMVNNVWQAGAIGGGGTPNWETAKHLWNYVTANTGNGPRATGTNNNQPYYNLSPSTIYYGNALQVRRGSSGDYGHSVFVTYSLDSSTTEYNQVLVSQHTPNLYNRNLWELIQTWGGNNCYLRKMSFNSASFSS